jgi:ABC-type sugar transport system substrate-binding protein
MPSLGAEFFTATAETCKEAVEAAGYTANIQSFEYDASKAVEVIENFISDGVVGIAYMTIDNSGDDALKEAMNQGIAVLTCGAENENYDICQIVDNTASGYAVGQMAVDYINANLTADAQIAVVGATSSQQMIDRTNGIKAALTDAGLSGNIVYEGEMTGTGDGSEFAENLNTLYPDCQVVVCYSDTFAAEISEVFSALSYPSTAAIFGHDGETKVLSDIANGGYIKGSYMLSDAGTSMGEGIVSYLNGEEGFESGSLIVMDGWSVTPDNVGEFYTE